MQIAKTQPFRLLWLWHSYNFRSMHAFVDIRVQGYETCKRNNTLRHQPHGLLQRLQIPDVPWQSLSMDAIVKLPPSHCYDRIMVIIDRFTKWHTSFPTGV